LYDQGRQEVKPWDTAIDSFLDHHLFHEREGYLTSRDYYALDHRNPRELPNFVSERLALLEEILARTVAS
jgi:hypothetical protein